jgi:hypothetical protein
MTPTDAFEHFVTVITPWPAAADALRADAVVAPSRFRSLA